MNLLKHIAMAVLTGVALVVGQEIAHSGLERRRLRKLRETAMSAKLKKLDLRVKTIEELLSEHEDDDDTDDGRALERLSEHEDA